MDDDLEREISLSQTRMGGDPLRCFWTSLAHNPRDMHQGASLGPNPGMVILRSTA